MINEQYDKPNSQNIPEEVKFFFGKESPLKNTEALGNGKKYENRPQQNKMAEAVAEAFINSKNHCIEAPTGVGKSFAYLIPAIFFALKQSKPVIISTETINLQEQLILKDIPLLKNLINDKFIPALAKGRTNYLCKRRLEMATGEHQSEYVPDNNKFSEIYRISEWSKITEDGSLSALDFSPSFSIWYSICSEHGNCLATRCIHFRKCFYWKARKQWEKANIVVANHALFLADLKMKMEGDLENGILPQYSGIVIDEAHQLETNAAKHLGTRITESGIKYFLNKLFNPETGRGLLLRQGEKAIELRQQVNTAYSSTESFFSSIRNKFINYDESQKRIHTPYFVNDILTGQLSSLEKELSDYAKSQEDKNYKQELETQIMRCSEYKNAVFNLLSMGIEESVYWIEENKTRQKQSYSLNYSPLNIADILKENLFLDEIPVILTSATLAVANRLDYYTGRIGYSGDSLILDTPFNYSKQAKVYVTRNIPDLRDKRYHDILADNIIKFVKLTLGKAFVLFTSYSSMLKVKEKTRSFFENNNITLLVQGEHLNRSNMIKIFKKDLNSVIFGTTSFWMGVDVPGKALSNVIITKLPFSVPTEPIIEARIDRIKENGGNPFMEYSLPEAVLKFKQGTGRLIRSENDSGILVILDNRIVTKRYGKVFLNSIPKCPVIIE
ncbi:MAG: DEAD/DEAH box helicase family protein [Victivallales bacterium]|nr:DEAD/DEAH box helicase family protein [Victivallales bacterium]MCF7888799.1 DEAD/DEAH box helicase family protein [Victivallales bacterium]